MIGGMITIVEEQAETVDWIFRTFASGSSLNRIAKTLNEENILSARGTVSWNHAGIGNIIRNKKYLGNEHFPAIIAPDLFEQAQKAREQAAISYEPKQGKNKYFYSGKIICGECGGTFYRDKIRQKSIWRCRYYIKDNHVTCKNRQLLDEELAIAGKELIRELLRNPDIYRKQPIDKLQIEHLKTPEIDEQIQAGKEQRVSSEHMLRLYFRCTEKRYALLKMDDIIYLTDRIGQALKCYIEKSEVEEELLLNHIITTVTVYKDGRMDYRLINGIKITIIMKGG